MSKKEVKKEEKKDLEKEECHCKEGQECTCEDCNCDENECSCEECSCDECEGCGDNNAELEALTKYVKELEEKVLREKAEVINYRKRKDEEIRTMLVFANEDLILELLPIVDNFERAIKLDNNDLSDELSKFLDGFKMIYTGIVNIFNKFNVKAIDGTSIPFDPAMHQAVLTEKIDGVEPGLVVEVLQKGYLYKDKVIRPAMVKVSE